MCIRDRLVRTHLGALLRAGDKVMGYDLRATNLPGECNADLESLGAPDVVLVRKAPQSMQDDEDGEAAGAKKRAAVKAVARGSSDKRAAVLAKKRGMSAAARACKFAARQSSKRWPLVLRGGASTVG